MNYRVTNFYPGPGALPISVLKRIESELFNFNGSGMSVMELSHRTDEIQFIIDDTAERIKRLLGLGKEYHVLLIQGGGSLQFLMAPLNFSHPQDQADYIDTGYWAAKAIREAELLGRDIAVVASSLDRDYIYVPNAHSVKCRRAARYLHLCTNNTVVGTQWHDLPNTPTPIVADMSSDFMSRAIDHTKIGCIYAHAQKNIGVAGVTVVIIRDDMLENIPEGLPTLLDYRTHIEERSNYHTPPCVAIYVTWLMMRWIEEEIGGIEEMGRMNQEKASLLYAYIDEASLFHCPVEVGSRSLMNVVFDLPSNLLVEQFIKEAAAADIVGVAGHRSIGGCRVSLYNAVTLDAVKQLIDFMHTFQKRY